MDNSPLIVFRILFGILISLECFGAIATGWVRRTFIEPKFTFTFIGFEWLQPLPGSWMYLYFSIMGLLGLMVALGYKYRFSIFSFTLMWTGAYLMQKTAYNNHYYLLILVSFFMCFFPANRGYSLDVRRHPAWQSDSMFSYIKWLVVLQLLIVYTYAGLAKLYGDWLDLRFIRLLMKSREDTFLIGDWLQQPWVWHAVKYIGIGFDLLIIPAMLWKPSRKIAFTFAVFFHLFNSAVFQIGIFPYLSLAFMVFFFEPETIRRIFLRDKKPYVHWRIERPRNKAWILWGWGLYLAVQLLLPVRHYFFRGDVLWTEEGHRMSWRMMLRNRSGHIIYRVKDKDTGRFSAVHLNDFLTKKQQAWVAIYPDLIWQFAQHLKQEYALQGKDVAIYVNSKVGINGRPMRPFIDPTVDLANIPWEPFKHSNWILPSKSEPGGP